MTTPPDNTIGEREAAFKFCDEACYTCEMADSSCRENGEPYKCCLKMSEYVAHQVKRARYGSEVWQPISDYPWTGKYEVSSAGRVRRGDKILKQSNNGTGYLVVTLSENNQQKTQLVHRLVARAFIINTTGQSAINHKDGDKKNNVANNLEWMSLADNNRHAYRTGLNNQTGESNAFAKLTDEQALAIQSSDEKTDVLVERYKVSPTTIRDIRRKHRWSHLNQPVPPPKEKGK